MFFCTKIKNDRNIDGKSGMSERSFGNRWWIDMKASLFFLSENVRDVAIDSMSGFDVVYLYDDEEYFSSTKLLIWWSNWINFRKSGHKFKTQYSHRIAWSCGQ